MNYDIKLTVMTDGQITRDDIALYLEAMLTGTFGPSAEPTACERHIEAIVLEGELVSDAQTAHEAWLNGTPEY